MKIIIPKYLYTNGYYWFFLRMVEKLFLEQKIVLAKIEDKPLYTPFVSVVFFDSQPIILDVRDDHALPLPELKKYPNALIFKANYSSELWDNPPETYEYPITDEERKYRSQVRPFIYGRAFGMSLNTNERKCFKHCIQAINKKIVSYTGAGVYRQQTESRLRVYDLISEVMGDKSELVWYDRKDHYDNKWSEYEQRRQKYLDKNNRSWDYDNYLRFLSQGQYSLNVPGIAASQPFRFIDGILANRVVISTKIWIDAWKSFPCCELPICGYFGTGSWENAKKSLEYFIYMHISSYSTILEDMDRWYDQYLTAEGMFENQFLKGLNK